MKILPFLVLLLGLPLAVPAAAQSAAFVATPTASVERGLSYTIQTRYSFPTAGTLSVQLFNPGWGAVATTTVSIAATGSRTQNLVVPVPVGTPVGPGHRWMVQVRNAAGTVKAESFRNDVTVRVTSRSAAFASPPPTGVNRGAAYTLQARYSYPTAGTLKVQLFDAGWNVVASSPVVSVPAGAGNRTLAVTVPAAAPAGGGHLWMVQVRDAAGNNVAESFVNNVTVAGTPPAPGGQFLPGGPGGWTLGWHDEFKGLGIGGTGEPANWYAHMGSGAYNYDVSSEHGLRWSGLKPGRSGTQTVDSSWMFSTKFANKLSDGKGTYWLDGSPEGKLILRAAVDKRDTLNNANFNNAGRKVEAAYLQTGRPVRQTASNNYPRPAGYDPWEGTFVRPGAKGIYLSCRAKTGQIKGWSTWFAFWAHTHTQAYDNKTGPGFSHVDGTEIDIVEIWGSKAAYTFNGFSQNNHWRDDTRTSASNPRGLSTFTGIRYDGGPDNDPDPPFNLTVQDGNWHEYGLLWERQKLTFYVDGNKTFDTTDHVPSDPRDMMILLTLEFELDKWDGAGQQGDGRTEGPSIYDDANDPSVAVKKLREMSRVEVDWVRVHNRN